MFLIVVCCLVCFVVFCFVFDGFFIVEAKNLDEFESVVDVFDPNKDEIKFVATKTITRSSTKETWWAHVFFCPFRGCLFSFILLGGPSQNLPLP